MIETRAITVVLLIILVFLAGCPGVEPGPGTTVTFDGRVNVTDSQFHMGGQIAEQPGTSGFHEFEDVQVYLYTEDGSPITTEYVGTFDTRANVSINTTRIPYYIIIDSPSFWKIRNIEVDYYERGLDDLSTVYTATSREDLPVVPSRND